MVQSQPAPRAVPATSPVGSGALSHAYIQYPPLQVNIPVPTVLIYDDGNKLLLVPSANKVLSWSVNQQPPPDSPRVTTFVEGPVIFVRFSLDERILAVQRSGQEVDFINREDGATFRQRCKQGTDKILGLFWTDCPACDVVFVTSSGLELYTLDYGRTGLKLIDTKRSNVSWYAYTHESRLVILASGMQCKTLSGYQFSAGGIIRLPKFDVAMAKAEVNSKPVLAFQDVRIATMYGRLYCLQVDKVAMQLHLYRFYRDAVVLQGFLPIYSGHVTLSVVDNVLLIHEIDSKVVLLYDVMSDSSVPVSAPLPLLIRGASANTSSRNATEPLSSHGTSLEIDHSERLTLAEATVYENGWTFVNPDIVLDHARGVLWKIQIDLEAIAASSSDMLTLLAFLQRRSREASKAKFLSLEVIRSMIMERQPLPVIARAMDILTSSYARAGKHVNVYDRAAVNKSQLSRTSGSPISAPFQAPGEANFKVESTDSLVQAGEANTNNRMEPSVVLLDVEAQDSSAEDNGNSGLVSSRVENVIPNSSTADGSQLESKLDIMKLALSKRESEIDSLAVPPTREGYSVSGEVIGRAWQPGHSRTTVNDDLQVANSPLISPEEMQQSVFSSLDKDMIVDSSFMVATMIEYLYSAAAEHLRVTPGLHVLIVQLLAQQQQYYELWQLTVSKVVPPSKAVALQLLEIGKQDISTRKLGMDMLRELHGHTNFMNLLLQGGHVLEAIRYSRQSKMEIPTPALFLQSAMDSKEPQMLASVFRFCLESVPNFRQTSDFNMYLSILRQQCTTFVEGST